jgi:hypothetical protein
VESTTIAHIQSTDGIQISLFIILKRSQAYQAGKRKKKSTVNGTITCIDVVLFLRNCLNFINENLKITGILILN